jgi:hypothetical protein
MTIAQQLNVKDFPFEIKDKNGKEIYREGSHGSWEKLEFNTDGKLTRYDDSHGYWEKSEYDANGNKIYYENSNGIWCKWEYDANSNEIYYENSNGSIVDKRPKQVELTLEDIATKFGVDVNQLKIKK